MFKVEIIHKKLRNTRGVKRENKVRKKLENVDDIAVLVSSAHVHNTYACIYLNSKVDSCGDWEKKRTWISTNVYLTHTIWSKDNFLFLRESPISSC